MKSNEQAKAKKPSIIVKDLKTRKNPKGGEAFYTVAIKQGRIAR